MIIKNENELLNQAVRRKIIEDINGPENLNRKNQMYKRYQCYKDQTYKYVQAELLKQFDADTVNEMSYALSNIAITRKVIDKLARVYKYGVEREVYIDGEESEELTLAVKEISDEINVNKNMKKANRYFKLFKNTLIYVRPKPVNDDKQTISIDALPPYLYDAVEMIDNREKPIAIILSDYSPAKRGIGQYGGLAVLPGTDGRNGRTVSAYTMVGDGIDQAIADTPGDEASKGYVFWTENYHFVCNSKGEIIGGPDDQLNPVKALPFVNFAEDQDGSFWAIGGDDLADGAVLMNSMITNILHIGVTQGYGQLVVTGKDIPSNIKVGPNKAIKLNQEEGDPTPTFEYKNANPPLDQLRALVEMYVALLLTTNNLSTSGVASNLNGSGSFPSGIAMMIDKAESMEDVEDQRQVFEDGEPLVWELYAKWSELLSSKNELDESLTPIPVDFDLRLKFGKPVAIESEKERLEVMKLKKEMGIVSMVDLIKMENPGLTDEEAEEKLMKILKQNIKRVAGGLNGEVDSNNNNDVGDEFDIGDTSGRSDEAGSRGISRGADSSDGSSEEVSDNGSDVSSPK